MKKITMLLSVYCCFVLGSFVSAEYAAIDSPINQYYISSLQQHNIPMINLNSAEIKPMAWTPGEFDTNNNDFFYRLAFLPTKYQDHEEYILLRRFGVMLPLINISKEDRILINEGKEINHYPYLEKGVVHHFGTKPQNGFGNFSIAGHSSFGKDEDGDFKTAFLPLLMMEAGDEIQYYVRSDDQVMIYNYRISFTDIVAPEDAYILAQPETDEYQLTAYACYPAGSNKQRKYVRAVLENSSVQEIFEPSQALHAAAPIGTGANEITIAHPKTKTGLTSKPALSLHQKQFFAAIGAYISDLEVTEIGTIRYIGGKDVDRWKETIVMLYKKFVVES